MIDLDFWTNNRSVIINILVFSFVPIFVLTTTIILMIKKQLIWAFDQFSRGVEISYERVTYFSINIFDLIYFIRLLPFKNKNREFYSIPSINKKYGQFKLYLKILLLILILYSILFYLFFKFDFKYHC
jgi:hypothetical protein